MANDTSVLAPAYVRVARTGADASRTSGGGIMAVDVRVRREIAHRRLAISLLRQLMRVLTLHLADGLLVAAGFWAVANVWGTWGVVQPYLPVVVASFLLSLNAFSAYAPGDARRDGRRLASASGLAAVLLLCLSAFPPEIPFTPQLLSAVGAACFVGLALGRKGIDLLVRQAYVRGFGLRKALVIGGLDEVGAALRDVRDPRTTDQYVVGHLTTRERPDPASLGDLGELERVLDEMELQEVLVATTLPPDELRSVVLACFDRGVKVYVIPGVGDGREFYAEATRMGDCPIVHLHPARLQLPSLLVKRSVDVVLALVAVVVASPLFLLISLAIKAESTGPVFFKQQRVGLGGRRFTMWKFRSMAVDAEAREVELAHLNIYGNGTFKLRHDPRVTRMGKILRRTSLDELPQLFNVLLGDMSIVGPRPALVNDISRYEPHHFDRLSVVPGITGPWQVNGRNLITDFDEILRMERSYIAEWSLWLDVRIMLRTLVVVLRGEGAY
ncbi:MAG: Undecaprenyl-phosphate galactosephosphotransferase [uncultured Gemmatimonadetes bacterium]|uniref:Undecaprenyl-phosphate galactosephosphotransferase n=1 Tax=uncultured Gemmatimonadota bacterium TaxID=203437 RepID=A0A6J4N160_9BACT|nr:MAG: Undecaprenyl-phosphate galactosephosphotransferase [uncultured Gemmatimonadota bacterium]